MLSLDSLLQYAREQGMPTEKRRGIVREYLQTAALLFLQHTPYAPRLIFIGGTAIRFFYDLKRFSEDLDLNYAGTLTRDDIDHIARHLLREFSVYGIEATYSVRKSRESYFHWKVNLQFPDVLRAYGVAGRSGGVLQIKEKLSIQLDVQNLGRKKYPTEKKLVSRFGHRFVFTTAPLDMFLAEKSNAVLFRKPPRGRDFFDWMCLVLLGASMNRAYLAMRDVHVPESKEYVARVKRRVDALDFTVLTKQLEPFLFRREDVVIMRDFPKYLDDLLSRLSANRVTPTAAQTQSSSSDKSQGV